MIIGGVRGLEFVCICMRVTPALRVGVYGGDTGHDPAHSWDSSALCTLVLRIMREQTV